MRCSDRHLSEGIRSVCLGTRTALAVSALMLGVVGCAGSVSAPGALPTPDVRGQSGILGTWVGTITNPEVAPGTATLAFEAELITLTVPLVSGRWTFTFPDARFSSQGAVSASPNVEGTRLVVFFDRMPLPCPVEPGGVAQTAVAAVLTPSGNRLQGTYVAGSCPGGALDVARR